MSDSTTNVDQLLDAQDGNRERVNENMNALSGALAFARRLASTGLTWAYYGIARWYVNATPVTKANTNIALTASSTRYLAADRALAVTENATAFPADKLALYKVPTGASAPSSWEDHRDPHHIVRFLWGQVDIAMGGSNKTLTYEQAMCEVIRLTGSSAALLDVIVPTVPRGWIVHADTTGGGGIRVKTSAGTGITIADGKHAMVRCDGTNVLRVTGDA